MNIQSFEVLMAAKNEDGGFELGIRRLETGDLPEGELLIEVRYSGVNYKDAMACSPDSAIVKKYPFVPGIDLAGVVLESVDERFEKGAEVLVTGYELGVSHYGGFSGLARVPADWAVPLPAGLTLKETMIFGTAGFTAALSVYELLKAGVAPESGPVLVTGATGGVGSLSVAILSGLGFETAASTGKADMHDFLRGLGAAHIVSREELIPSEPRPLDKQRWAGAVDCVGGKTLSSLLGSIRYGGAVAASGMTGGIELSATVYPFILRGIRLIGIDSVYAPAEIRRQVWGRLASDFKPAALSAMYTEIGLAQIPEIVPGILGGQARGRYLVKL